MSIPKTKQTFVLSLVLVVLLCVATAGMVYLLIMKGYELDSTIEEVAKTRSDATHKASLVQLAESTAAERAELGTYIFNTDDTSAYLTEIEDVARGQGVDLVTTGISETPAEPPSLFGSLQLSIQMSGPARGVERMLELFENSPYLGAVRTMQISIATVGVIEETWNMNISFVLYTKS